MPISWCIMSVMICFEGSSSVYPFQSCCSTHRLCSHAIEIPSLSTIGLQSGKSTMPKRCRLFFSHQMCQPSSCCTCLYLSIESFIHCSHYLISFLISFHTDLFWCVLVSIEMIFLFKLCSGALFHRYSKSEVWVYILLVAPGRSSSK